MSHPVFMFFFALFMLAFINVGEAWAAGKLFPKKRKKSPRRPDREEPEDFEPDMRDWR